MDAKKKVLLVDDDADFVELNRVEMERNGLNVLTAFNKQECMAKAVVWKPDVIVLDVMMERLSDGFDVARDLRKHAGTKHIPLLMVTSVNDTVPYKFGPDEEWLPVDKFVEKPIEPERLVTEVKGMLGRMATR